MVRAGWINSGSKLTTVVVAMKLLKVGFENEKKTIKEIVGEQSDKNAAKKLRL